MRMIGKVLAWLLVVLLLIVVAGFVFLKTFDLNRYKGLIEKVAEDNLGRKLSIAGDASVALSLVPTIVINDISLANPSWAKEPEMIKVKSVELEFSILPLLEKQIVIAKALVSGVDIYLETAADGKNSWDFDLPAKKVSSGGWLISEANAAELSDGDFREMLTSIVAKEVTINNAKLRYFEQKNSKVTKFDINNLTFSMDGFDNPLDVEWNIVFDDMHCQGMAKTGSVNQIMDRAAEFPLVASVKAMNVKLDINAKIRDIFAKPKFAFDINANNPAGNFAAPAVDLQASGAFADNKLNLNIANLNLAKNIIKGTAFIDIAQKLPFVRANLSSELLDLRTLTAVQKKTTYFPEIISSAHASQMVPNDKIPFDLLKSANADVKLVIGSLVVDEALKAKNVQMNALLDNGVLDVSKLKLDFGGGEVDVFAKVDANTKSVLLNLSSKNVIIQDLHGEFKVRDGNDFGFISGGSTQIFADLKGSGATYRQLVDSLQGPLVAIVDKSELQSGSLQFINGSIVAQILDLLKLDTKKQKKFELKCAVVRADFVAGKVLFPKGIAVDSDKATVVSGGDINLLNDKLNLTLNAYGSGFADVSIMQALSNLILIRGTIQSPKISLDTKNAMKTIATAALIPGVGPAVVGTQMVFDKDIAPCYTALQGTKYSTYFAKPTGVNAKAQDSYQDASKIINNGVDRVEGLRKDAKKILKGLLKR